MNDQQLNQLIQELLDGSISQQNLADLEAELLRSEHARHLYLNTTEIHSFLEQKETFTPYQSCVVPMDRILRRQKRKTLRIAAAAAAAILVISVLVMQQFFVKESPSTLTFQASTGSKFVLTHQRADNQPEGLVLEKGSQLRLQQGTVELTFGTGVKSIIMAPADLTLHDDDKLFLKRGTAWFQVPQQAIGFQVLTKDLKIVDLGTEFGVVAHPDEHDEVHVFKGRVAVTANRLRKENTQLVAGQSRRIDPVGRLTQVPSQPKRFLTTFRKSLPHLHWSFDNIRDGGFPAEGHDPRLTDAVAKPQGVASQQLQTKGKFGQAVSFVPEHNQGLITSHPGFDPQTPFSVCYWVKIPSETQRQRFIPHVAWAMPQSDSRYARWIFHSIFREPGIWYHQTSCSGFSRGTINLADGEWHHVAAVFTGNILDDLRPELLFYIDGELDSIGEIMADKIYHYTDQSGKYFTQPIILGADTNHIPRVEHQARFQMDEVFIIQGALTPKQIDHLRKTNQLP